MALGPLGTRGVPKSLQYFFLTLRRDRPRCDRSRDEIRATMARHSFSLALVAAFAILALSFVGAVRQPRHLSLNQDVSGAPEGKVDFLCSACLFASSLADKKLHEPATYPAFKKYVEDHVCNDFRYVFRRPLPHLLPQALWWVLTSSACLRLLSRHQARRKASLQEGRPKAPSRGLRVGREVLGDRQSLRRLLPRERHREQHLQHVRVRLPKPPHLLVRSRAAEQDPRFRRGRLPPLCPTVPAQVHSGH